MALYPIFSSKDLVRKYLLLHQSGNLVMVITVQVDCVLTYSNPCWLAGWPSECRTICKCCNQDSVLLLFLGSGIQENILLGEEILSGFC